MSDWRLGARSGRGQARASTLIMATSPIVSVVIPSFNAEAYLGEALASIAAQEIDELEVILVDDGSASSPEPVLRRVFPGATYIRQSNQGPAAARNRGIAAARGRYVAFLDADDLWSPGALAALLRGFADAPDVEVVQGYQKTFEQVSVGATHRRGSRPAFSPAFASVSLGALLISRDALGRTGGFDEGLRFAEDVDFHMHLREQGIAKMVIAKVVLLNRRHRASMTSTNPRASAGFDSAGDRLRRLSASLRRRKSAMTFPLTTMPAVARAPFHPTVTAAIVLRNGVRHVEAALASIRRQTRPPAEILCVLGPSEDGTRDILMRQTGLRLIEQAGRGLAAARNQAIAAATGSHIAFLDHDDLWLPRKLEAQLAALAPLKEPGVSLTGMRCFEDFETGGDDFSLPVRGAAIRLGTTPSALLADRCIFERIGGFDETMSFGCDGDWFVRALDSAVPISVASEALVLKRLRADNLSHDPGRNRAEAFQIIARRHRRGITG
jgi:glycosyltransferase involved in cell wall biosynthesis